VGDVKQRIAAVTLHSNAGKCAFGSRYCTQISEFAELFVLKSRTESDARKKDPHTILAAELTLSTSNLDENHLQFVGSGIPPGIGPLL